MVDINRIEPMRSGNNRHFTSSENGCTHRADNRDYNDIRQFKVDGQVYSAKCPTERCDYLVINDTKHTAYFIELKGSDIERAIVQVDTSIADISPSISNYSIFRRIIYKTGSHKVNSSRAIKWKKEHKGRAIIKERLYVEVI